MKIRNPFKDYLGRWKDDATNTEKFCWSAFLAFLGMFTGRLLFEIFKLYINNLFNFNLAIYRNFLFLRIAQMQVRSHFHYL